MTDLPARTVEACRHPDNTGSTSRERLTTGATTPAPMPPLQLGDRSPPA